MTDETPTIEQRLRAHAVDPAEIERRYPGPSGLVRRILGVLPRATSMFEIWPPALVTYNLSVPALLDVPKCDIGLGISPELRALVAHAASRSFGCQYCTAHTAIMGTIVRGPLDTVEMSGRVIAARAPGELRKAEQIAVEYADAVASVPHRLGPELRAALRSAHRPDHVEAIALVAVAMGYLNRFMDTLGTTLETAVHDAVSDGLAKTGWAATKHLDEHAMTADRAAGKAELARPSKLGLFREIPGAVAYERAALAGVPSAAAEQSARLSKALGFVPHYVTHISRSPARRVLVHWVLDRLHPSGLDVGSDVKYRMAWVLARAAKCDALAAHFAFLAHREGVDVAGLLAAEVAPADPAASPETAALALAHASARASSIVPGAVIDALAERHRPASVIELLTVLAIVCGLQRLVATFPPEGYEPEIQQFVTNRGDALGLPKRLPPVEQR